MWDRSKEAVSVAIYVVALTLLTMIMFLYNAS